MSTARLDTKTALQNMTSWFAVAEGYCGENSDDASDGRSSEMDDSFGNSLLGKVEENILGTEVIEERGIEEALVQELL